MNELLAAVLLMPAAVVVFAIVATFCSTILVGRRPCPQCRGSGKGDMQLTGYRQDWDGASPLVMRSYPVYKRDKCLRCGGSGTVPTESIR